MIAIADTRAVAVARTRRAAERTRANLAAKRELAVLKVTLGTRRRVVALHTRTENGWRSARRVTRGTHTVAVAIVETLLHCVELAVTIRLFGQFTNTRCCHTRIFGIEIARGVARRRYDNSSECGVATLVARRFAHTRRIAATRADFSRVV